ncbi:hypothetical protein TeGR_g8631 [Tetraparma gracilis]|uniref:Uncharacterized protein n=1 Tax=Tetraparma gracilis TaxID=2962635 RepID=A0ABQ6MVU2_9STRA|nr:hypothetical protein TeGR_g8631 [Tetraparma gracilis]
MSNFCLGRLFQAMGSVGLIFTVIGVAMMAGGGDEDYPELSKVDPEADWVFHGNHCTISQHSSYSFWGGCYESGMESGKQFNWVGPDERMLKGGSSKCRDWCMEVHDFKFTIDEDGTEVIGGRVVVDQKQVEEEDEDCELRSVDDMNSRATHYHQLGDTVDCWEGAEPEDDHPKWRIYECTIGSAADNNDVDECWAINDPVATFNSNMVKIKLRYNVVMISIIVGPVLLLLSIFGCCKTGVCSNEDGAKVVDA